MGISTEKILPLVEVGAPSRPTPLQIAGAPSGQNSVHQLCESSGKSIQLADLGGELKFWTGDQHKVIIFIRN